MEIKLTLSKVSAKKNVNRYHNNIIKNELILTAYNNVCVETTD